MLTCLLGGFLVDSSSLSGSCGALFVLEEVEYNL
jgi:hypothetical protein